MTRARVAAVAAGTICQLVVGPSAVADSSFSGHGHVRAGTVTYQGTRHYVKSTGSRHRSGGHRARTRATPAPPPPVWVYNTEPTPEQLAECAAELATNPSCAGSGQWMTPVQAAAAVQDPTTDRTMLRVPTLGDIITATQQQTKTLAIPPRRVAVEPGGGEVLVRMPTNFYTDNRPLVRSLTVLGVPVTVSIYPQTFTWDTGDGGQVGPTRDPGARYPAMTTTHTYTRPGSYRVSLTTTYAVTATIPGQGTIPLPGRGETVQQVDTLDVRTARTRLVAPSG